MTKPVDINPWASTIRLDNVIGEDHDAIVTDIMMVAKTYDREPLDTTKNLHREEFASLRAFVEAEILPRMLTYAETLFDLPLEIVDWNGWVRACSDGEGAQLHEHAGAHISAVYYLEGEWGDLAIQDPRGNAGRGYPSEIRRKHFTMFEHTPTRGSLIIFPSYLYHYVQNHPPGLRIAVPIDLHVRGREDREYVPHDTSDLQALLKAATKK